MGQLNEPNRKKKRTPHFNGDETESPEKFPQQDRDLLNLENRKREKTHERGSPVGPTWGFWTFSTWGWFELLKPLLAPSLRL